MLALNHFGEVFLGKVIFGTNLSQTPDIVFLSLFHAASMSIICRNSLVLVAR